MERINPGKLANHRLFKKNPIAQLTQWNRHPTSGFIFLCLQILFDELKPTLGMQDRIVRKRRWKNTNKGTSVSLAE